MSESSSAPLVTFQERLKKGHIIEDIVSRYFMSSGRTVLPVYETSENAKKGPQIFCFNGGIVAPDMLVFPSGGGSPSFAEVKYKSVFSYHYSTGKWTTGIDTFYLNQYEKAKQATGLPVDILFFHAGSIPSDSDIAHRSPKECPTGLFAGEISDLLNRIHHSYRGMSYWAHEDLQLIATLAEVRQVVGESQCA